MSARPGIPNVYDKLIDVWKLLYAQTSDVSSRSLVKSNLQSDEIKHIQIHASLHHFCLCYTNEKLPHILLINCANVKHIFVIQNNGIFYMSSNLNNRWLIKNQVS